MNKDVKVPKAIKQLLIQKIILFSVFVVLGLLSFILGGFICFLPCGIISVYLVISFFTLRDKVLKDRVIIIKGEVVEIEQSKFFKRTKSISFTWEEKKVRIITHKKVKNIVVGDMIAVYIADKEPIYYYNDDYVLSNYYAFEKELGE